MSAGLLVLIALPALAAAALWWTDRPRRSRRAALAAAGATLATALAVLVQASSGGRLALEIRGLALAVDGARAVLAAVVALLAVGALAFAPRRSIDARAAAAVLIAEAGALLALTSATPWLALVGWALSTTPLMVGPSGRAEIRLARVTTALSVALAGAAVLAESMGWSAQWVSSAWIVAALARLGVPPFHPWAVAGLHRARPAASVFTIVSPLPLSVLAHEVPALSAGSSVPLVLLVLGCAGAAYASLLALVQVELRRALAYLHVSIASTLVASIGSATPQGVAGALLAGVSSTLAISGLVFLAGAVEARRGTGDMRALGGLYTRLPLASAGFLLFAFTAVGFPGTIGFVSEDLVMQGLVPAYPAVAVLVLVVAALNGITLFRCFKRTFLGPPSAIAPPIDGVRSLVRRERAIGFAWAFVLLLGGLVPAPLLAIRESVDAAFAERDVAARSSGDAARSPGDGGAAAEARPR